MPRLSTSDRTKTRVFHLFHKLLDYANNSLGQNDEDEPVTVRWVGETSATPKLIVQTTLQALLELAFPDAPEPNAPAAKNQDDPHWFREKVSKDQLRHDLRLLKDFLQILEDNRLKTQGAENWHFTLKLWHHSTDANLTALEQLWRDRKAESTQSPNAPLGQSDGQPPAASPTLAELDEADRPDSSPVLNPIIADALSRAAAATALQAIGFHHNLPQRRHTAFIGSKLLMTRLLKLLAAEHSESLVSLVGSGGVGKTTLALEAAHRCLAASQDPELFPTIPTFDAIIFTSAKSQDWIGVNLTSRLRPERNLQDVFRVICRTLKRLDSLPADFEQQIDFVRASLADRQTLLIVDNIETLTDQEYLLAFIRELPPTVKVVLTSRVRLGLGTVIPMDCLPKAESLELISHQAQSKAVVLTAEQAEAIHQKTAGLPLAIAYAIGQTAVYGRFGQELFSASPSLPEDLIRYCFEDLVRPLRGQPAHRLLMAFSLFARIASPEVLTQIAFVDPDPAQIQASLATLHRLSLIEYHDDRYEMHSLTRQFSALELQQHPDVEQQMRDRWVTWYLALLEPYQQHNPREWQEYHRLEQEWDSLRDVIEWCKLQNRYDDVRRFWQSLKGYTQIHGHWSERLEWLEWLLQAAEQRQDGLTMVEVMYDTSRTLSFFNQLEQVTRAIDLCQRAWEMANQLEMADRCFRVDLAIRLAALFLRQERYDQSDHWLDRGQFLLCQTDPASEQSSPEPTTCDRQWVEIFYYRAEMHFKLKQYPLAKLFYTKALNQAEKIGWQRLISYSQGWLAAVAIAQDEWDEAEDLLKAVWTSTRQSDDRRGVATCQSYFAHLEKARGNLPAAQLWATLARDDFERLNMNEQAAEMEGLLQG